jgi:hypothetical protein
VLTLVRRQGLDQRLTLRAHELPHARTVEQSFEIVRDVHKLTTLRPTAFHHACGAWSQGEMLFAYFG